MSPLSPQRRRFSFAEIMVVVGLIMLIMGIAIPHLVAARSAAREGAALGAIKAAYTAQEMYLRDHGAPGTLEELGEAKLIDTALALGKRDSYRYVVAFELVGDAEEEEEAAPQGPPTRKQVRKARRKAKRAARFAKIAAKQAVRAQKTQARAEGLANKAAAAKNPKRAANLQQRAQRAAKRAVKAAARAKTWKARAVRLAAQAAEAAEALKREGEEVEDEGGDQADPASRLFAIVAWPATLQDVARKNVLLITPSGTVYRSNTSFETSDQVLIWTQENDYFRAFSNASLRTQGWEPVGK